jgi:two-component system CheB/CheR fusion protein
MAALADDAGDRSVGIVLSGTDHDGTAGLRAIRAAGGLTLVQRPETAQFKGMPDSGIAAGVADQVLAPEDMPAALSAYLAHVPIDLDSPLTPFSALDAPEKGLQDVLGILLARTGHDFRWYRPGMLRRRLRRRMGLTGADRVADYVSLLEHSSEEVEALKGEFLIGVTDFFRDPEAWQALAGEVLPQVLATRAPEDLPVRVWTPGCATGEESYSIAMLVLEQFDIGDTSQRVQVFGTDIDDDALRVARRGSYPLTIEATVSSDRLARFFERRGDRYVVRKPLRDAVLFAPQSLVRDTPFSKLDLVLCRNLLIYFQPELQDRALRVFHFALKPGGFLLLGKAESIGTATALFEPASRHARLFRRVGGRTHLPRSVGHRSDADAVLGVTSRGVRRAPSPSEILRAQLGQREVAAAALIDRDGRALHFQGRMGQFLEPQGDATLELSALVRPELRAAVRHMLRQVHEGARAAGHHAMVPSPTGPRRVRVDVETVPDADGRGLMLVLLDTAPSETAGLSPDQVPGAADAPSSQELDDNRHELTLALEDAERSNEELRMANEESLALNEELQSSNEELESSKEELQALNEELATVNAQLEDKVGEVARGHDDLSNLLASTEIATLLLDRHLRIRRFTPAAATLFSVQAGDEGRLITDISSRVDDPGFFAEMNGVLTSLTPAEAEVRTSAGSWFLRRILPYRSGESDTQGVVVTFVDITPGRAAAQQARQLVSALEDSNDAVLTYDSEGRILSWNSAAQRVYGYARAEAMALGLFGITPPSAHASARELIALVRSSDRAGPLDAERLSRSGATIRVSVTVTALRDERGAVYAMLSTERDLTERLRAESEIRFRRLADDIPALLRVEDAAGRAQFVNQACCRFTGQDRAALLGEGWLQFLHPEDRQAYVSDYARALPSRDRFETDLRLLRHDGVYRWMRTISVPHFDPDGGYSGYVALMLDVEDRKQAETELVAADRRKDEYLAMLAHELRNPLAPIRNAAAILARTPGLDATSVWATGVIGRQTDVMAKLLEDLLDVARIARGKVPLALAPVDVAVIVERAVEISRPLIDARRHRLTVDLPSEPLTVVGDLLRLTQVLANLINNAAKYTDEGGEIAIDARRDAREVVIGVIDNGAGITAAMVPHVFDLFAQADTTLDRSKGGLGLGLTLVRQLVKLHGGTVHAQSDGLAKGSRFVVRLPLLEQRSLPPAHEPTGLARGATAAIRRKVMVVDDNIDAAQTLAMILSTHGHDVRVVHDPRDVMAVASQFRPDVAILDIGLPHMDGYQLARHLRGHADTARVVLIALTGYGQPDDVDRAHAAGFDHHLVKPVEPETVNALIGRPAVGVPETPGLQRDGAAPGPETAGG